MVKLNKYPKYYIIIEKIYSVFFHNEPFKISKQSSLAIKVILIKINKYYLP